MGGLQHQREYIRKREGDSTDRWWEVACKSPRHDSRRSQAKATEYLVRAESWDDRIVSMRIHPWGPCCAWWVARRNAGSDGFHRTRVHWHDYGRNHRVPKQLWTRELSQWIVYGFRPLRVSILTPSYDPERREEGNRPTCLTSTKWETADWQECDGRVSPIWNEIR